MCDIHVYGRFHAESKNSSSARGSGARQVQVLGRSAPTSGYWKQFVVSADNYNEFKSRCE